MSCSEQALRAHRREPPRSRPVRPCSRALGRPQRGASPLRRCFAAPRARCDDFRTKPPSLRRASRDDADPTIVCTCLGVAARITEAASCCSRARRARSGGRFAARPSFVAADGRGGARGRQPPAPLGRGRRSAQQARSRPERFLRRRPLAPVAEAIRAPRPAQDALGAARGHGRVSGPRGPSATGAAISTAASSTQAVAITPAADLCRSRAPAGDRAGRRRGPSGAAGYVLRVALAAQRSRAEAVRCGTRAPLRRVRPRELALELSNRRSNPAHVLARACPPGIRRGPLGLSASCESRLDSVSPLVRACAAAAREGNDLHADLLRSSSMHISRKRSESAAMQTRAGVRLAHVERARRARRWRAGRGT